MTRFVSAGCAALLFLAASAQAILDKNGNGQSDVWEQQFGASGLAGATDSDGDGFTNAQEAIAGTDPLDPASHPALAMQKNGGSVTAIWPSLAGKRYQLFTTFSIDTPWLLSSTRDGTDGNIGVPFLLGPARQFFRLHAQDIFSDSDALSDWEERILGFDPANAHTDRFDQDDYQRVFAAWNAASTVDVVLIDGEMSERWPDHGVIAIRRSGGMKPITVNFALGGSATPGTDYTASAMNSIAIPAGAREVWVEFTPIADANDAEPAETITLTLQSGTGYAISGTNSATVNLANETASSGLSAKAAARFLIQAAFGPDQDSPADGDDIPQNVQTVMTMGFDAWLNDQFAKPATFIQPFTDYAATIPQFYTDRKVAGWWGRAMGSPTSIPNGPAVAYDALRQRVAFCLSQIVVVSDRPETLAVQPSGIANYYDMIISHAFGNYRDLLYDVARHPVMGFYLSSLKNQKPDAANNIFPDENFAREVMQLFAIGLWELNADGTRKKDALNRDIPTYDNTTITNFARVFTGMSFGAGSSFLYAADNWTAPMKMWDAYHDCNAKTLLKSGTIPVRTPSNPDTGSAGLADLNDAIDNIFNHPNVGPFVARQLIQRMVTSNPSAPYVGRVAAKFANNGAGVRGDMKTVIKAVLLDDEARNPAFMSDPSFGKMREPFLRVVNFARAFDAKAQSDFYALDSFFMDHYEEPMKSPSVFNFYLPNYTPPGEVQAAGLVAPEFQIMNATSAISAPNYYYYAILGSLHRWGTADPTRAVKLNLTQELALTDDAHLDALIRRLDLALTCGTLTPRNCQVIRESVLRIATSTYQWQNERVRLAIYLIVTSPEFCVLR